MKARLENINSLLINIAKDWQYSLFIFVLLGYTAFSSISNYSYSAFLLKGVWTVLFMTLAIFVRNREMALNPFQVAKFRKIILWFVLFSVYCSFTLLYSGNPGFGALKILNLYLAYVPLFAGYFIFFSTADSVRYRNFGALTSFVVLTSAVIIIVLQPFSYTGFYSLSFTNWSHVIYGRFIGLISLVILLLYLNDRLSVSHLNALLLFYFLSFLNFTTSLRASLLGLMITAVGLFLLRPAAQFMDKKIIIIVLSFALTFPTAFLFTQITRHSDVRINNLINYSLGANVADEPLHTRQTLYSLGWDLVRQNWWKGIGFGGFRNPAYGSDVMLKKYPHNVALEAWVELGLPGFLFYILGLLTVFILLWKLNKQFAVLLLYPLTLSMFSKDIPNQTLFALALALLALPANKLMNIPMIAKTKSQDSD